ncbi:MAG: ferritin [Actinomycetota bacterium]|nr:ferritin [Actinomycetota bacterium]
MLSPKVEEALNNQLQVELQSAYVYLGMAAHCENVSLEGFAKWLHRQAEEEYEHAMKFYNYINDRDGRVELQALDAPPTKYSAPLQVFETALSHERSVTEKIDDLYELVNNERDFASQAWLDWFVTEQVEEEKTVGLIVDQLKLIGDRGDGLFILDKELGSRSETPR